MAVSAECLHAFDADGAVSIDGNDGAHLLKNIDEVHNFGLDCSALQGRDAIVAHCRQQGLFSRANRGEGKFNDCAVKPGGRALDVNTIGLFFNDRAELT